MANYLLTYLRFCNFVNLSKGRNMNRIVIMMAVLLVSGVAPVKAQSRTLTLEDCREMAVASSKTLDQARTQVEMASYDRKIALANYFPEITATGAYLYNNRDIALISEDGSARLRGRPGLPGRTPRQRPPAGNRRTGQRHRRGNRLLAPSGHPQSPRRDHHRQTAGLRGR